MHQPIYHHAPVFVIAGPLDTLSLEIASLGAPVLRIPVSPSAPGTKKGEKAWYPKLEEMSRKSKGSKTSAHQKGK